MANWLQKYLIVGFIIILTGCGSATTPNPPTAPTANAPTASSTGAATIQLVPSEKEPKIEIWVNNVQQLYALELELSFDASKLKITDADTQKEGVQLLAGTAPVADFTVKNEAQAGTIHYIVTQMAPREGFNGSGVAATISLAEKLTDPAAISIKSAILVNQEGQPITTTIQN